MMWGASKHMGKEDHSMKINIEAEASSSKQARTLVLVGRTGNGKSAMGNSILGRKAFKHGSSSVGVTKTCELQTTTRSDGRTINIIDTPGLSALSSDPETTAKEILKCLTMAKQGINAILLVFSVRNRISQEEEYTLRILKTLFGPEIVDYVIVAFTGADDLEDNEETLEEYLEQGCPMFLKVFLEQCDNRLVLFDNKTEDKRKKAEQVEKLLTVVESVVRRNGGKPYMDELLHQLQMEQQLAEEQAALIEATRTETEKHKSVMEERRRFQAEFQIYKFLQQLIRKCGIL